MVKAVNGSVSMLGSNPVNSVSLGQLSQTWSTRSNAVNARPGMA
ncbi:hypothetical protein HanPSC8_Chr03g0098411 [Helianthus annuus]|nr:hypothetical protein HanPSC8_Chr03g0098411 [Helianthus annuus]